MKFIATNNCRIEFNKTVAKSEFTPSKEFKCNGHNCLAGELSIIATGVSDEAAGICSSVTIKIKGSSTSVKASGKKVLLEDDSGEAMGTFINTETGVTTELPVKATIKNAGQSEVSAI